MVEDERVREVVARGERDPHVVQAAPLVELADADVPVAAPPRDLLEVQPRAAVAAERERVGPVAAARRAVQPAGREAHWRRPVRRGAHDERPLLVPQRVVDAVADQPHEDAAGGREQRPGARAARSDTGDLRLRPIGDDLHAVAQLAQAAAREVPAAQQRRAADPLERHEIGAHRRAGEHSVVGSAHERDVAGQAALADIAQVGHVVAPLAADAMAVGPHAEPRIGEERVALAAERDRDVERRRSHTAAAGLAAIDGRHPREQRGGVDAQQRVRIAREDQAISRAVEPQQRVGRASAPRVLPARDHHERELDALGRPEFEQDIVLPTWDPPALERDANPDGALQPHASHSPASVGSASVRR